MTELIEQQTAISEVLRVIASSPHDLQPIFDAILDSATRLCRADIGALRLSEESGLRRVAVRGAPHLVSRALSLFPVFAEKGSLPIRLATRLPTHIPDVSGLEGDHQDDFWIAVVNAGLRACLVVPLLKDNEIVGTITLSRKQVQPFTDRLELKPDNIKYVGISHYHGDHVGQVDLFPKSTLLIGKGDWEALADPAKAAPARERLSEPFPAWRARHDRRLRLPVRRI